MAYNVLGIHPGHNGAAALVSDGELVYYLEEERFSRWKRDGNPFRAMVDICSKYKIDELVIGGTNDQLESNILPWTFESPYFALVRKYNPSVKITWLNYEHHLLHASCAFYNSGFNKAVILVIDGAGTFQTYNLNEKQKIAGFEAESIWTAQYPGKFKPVYKIYGKNEPPRARLGIHDFDDAVTITKAYEAVTTYLGWDAVEGGKTMGLAPYGKQNSKIPPLFKNGRGNRDIFIPSYPSGAGIDFKSNSIFERNREPEVFHRNQNELLEIEADLAWHIQNDTQEEIAKLIEKAIDLTGLNKVCIAGGYGLNCVTNYFIKKKFPNIEIYHEPVSHDGGTAIGAAKSVYHERKNDFEKRKQTSIYLGPKYSKEQLLKGIQKYVSN
jgi:carbamoyltransferase